MPGAIRQLAARHATRVQDLVCRALGAAQWQFLITGPAIPTIRFKFVKKLTILCLVVFMGASTLIGRAQPAEIDVNAGQPLHPISPYLTGACLEDVNHEIYGGLYSQMIFGESFQEPAPAEPLTGFSEYGGIWLVTNSALLSINGTGPKLMDNNVTQSSGDLKVQLQFAANEGGDAGFIFQVSQPGVGADVFTGYEVSLAPAGNVVLGRHRQNWESISQVAYAVPTGQWINLEVKYTNAAITVLVNGSRLIQYTDTQFPLTNGQVGLRNYQQDVQFRSFQINGANVPFGYDATNWPGAVSGMWTSVVTGSASGQCALETTNLFVGKQSQVITFTNGTGSLGIANQGLNHWGMAFVGGNEYTGFVDVQAAAPTFVWVALESGDGSTVYAQQSLAVTSDNWQHLDFTLTPSASASGGRFTIKLEQPGSVTVGYAFLEPGPWGQFQGLPVRKDVAEGLINQGVTVLRYGGSMVNAAGYRWTNMIGPRELRPPYAGTWYPYASDGWGIPDFLNFCQAAGFLAVPDFNINETPQDMANFMQYANGSTNTVWGARRAADGHPQPYGLKYLELGNEERVDSTYYQKFSALALAIWAADPNITLVVGDFSYHQVITNPFSFSGADSGITTLAAQQQILQLARQNNREVWFDVHVWDNGAAVDPSLTAMFSYDDALAQIAGGANYKVVVFELNAENHTQARALGNALAINAAERDGRLPIVTSANCLQPDGQNDNGWDQGLLFLNPSQVWLQPPGYVTQMYAGNYQPQEVWSRVTDPNHDLDVASERSMDGSQLVLKVVNLNSASEAALINLFGFVPTNSLATVTVLSAPLTATNNAQAPSSVASVTTNWPHNFSNNAVLYTFAPNSVTTLLFQGRLTGTTPPVLKHRYSFNGPAGGAIITDSVGGQNGRFSGSGGGLDGNGNLVFNGTDGYVDLGPDLISGYTNLTVEAWINKNPNDAAHARLFDFGDTDNNGEGAYGLDFSPQAGGGSCFEVFSTDPGTTGAQQLPGPSLAGTGLMQVVAVYDPQLTCANIYTNGALAAIGSINIPFSSLVDAHDYLGRSGYSGDPYLSGSIREFRVYSGDMGAVQVALDYAAGPGYVDTNFAGLTNLALSVASPVKVGQTVMATVTASYQDGQGINVASGHPSLQSGNTSVVAVGSNLTLTAVSPGTSTVVAGYGGLYATQTVTVLPLPVVLLHRYSFVSDASDSVGGPAWKGTLKAPNGGAPATISHGLILPGNQHGGFGYSGYVSMPAGILTNTASLTVECWVTQNQANGWAEIWDFGVNGNENFALIPFPENNNADVEVAFNPNNNDIYTASSVSIPNWAEQYVCVTFNNLTLTANLYANGTLVASQPYPDATYCPGGIGGAGGTTQNLLGNDVYGDSQFSGTVYELRIWNGALSSSQVLADYAAGPEMVPAIPPPLSIAQLGNAVILSWPATAAGYTVQTSTTLGAATDWAALPDTPAPVLSNATYQITLPVTNQAAFYRLSNL